MAPKKQTTLRCPTCRKLVLRSEPEFPFCSDRCRIIDLGKWASGGYVIATPITDPDAFGDAEQNSNAIQQRKDDQYKQ